MGFFDFINKMDPDVKKNLTNVALSLLTRANVKKGDVIIGGITLPIPPESFELSVGNNNETINIQNAGDISLIGKTGLKTITIESFLPATDNTYTRGINAYSIVDSFEDLRNSGSPTHILIAGTSVDMDAIINNFTYGEKDGSGDVYFTIELVEYKQLTDSPENALNSSNGLNKRKSFLEKVALNVTYKPGDHVGDVVKRAFLKADLSDEKIPPIVKSIVKTGKLNVGDVVTAEMGNLKINGDNLAPESDTNLFNGANNNRGADNANDFK